MAMVLLISGTERAYLVFMMRCLYQMLWCETRENDFVLCNLSLFPQHEFQPQKGISLEDRITGGHRSLNRDFSHGGHVHGGNAHDIADRLEFKDHLTPRQ